MRAVIERPMVSTSSAGSLSLGIPTCGGNSYKLKRPAVLALNR